MTAGKYNLTIEQGATLAQVFTWKDSTGALVNLTGYTARAQIRRTLPDNTTLLDLTTENGGITLGGALGTIQLNCSATNTALLTESGVWDLELISGATVTRLLEGRVFLSLNVTR